MKVADFGFARIKEENATMTRCGTPSWTAPEVIRGEKYGEAADIYSFGIIMWEVMCFIAAAVLPIVVGAIVITYALDSWTPLPAISPAYLHCVGVSVNLGHTYIYIYI